MKLFSIIISILVSVSVFGQDSDCGTWVRDTVIYEQWHTLDTICGRRMVNGTFVGWSENVLIDSDYTLYFVPDDDVINNDSSEGLNNGVIHHVGKWYYGNWRYVLNPDYTNLVYCRCGCGWDDWEERIRINDDGIRQMQRKVIRYKYIK